LDCILERQSARGYQANQQKQWLTNTGPHPPKQSNQANQQKQWLANTGPQPPKQSNQAPLFQKNVKQLQQNMYIYI
jgi:hypothetical protein